LGCSHDFSKLAFQDLANCTIKSNIIRVQMNKADKVEKQIDLDNPNYQTATFAGGCFWCMEPPYDGLEGIISTTVGYTGGGKQNPTYEEVCTGKTGHAEAVQIVFDSTKISYGDLLQVFWRNINPTDPYGQFADKGSQYRTAIFYHDEKQKELAEESKKELGASGKFESPIVTEIVPAQVFYAAEDYHQEFYKNHPLRYNSYKVGSGRSGYLKKMWGEEKKE
jgi:peptide methionine sulfoxide reductase msrA/msrB